MAGGVETSCHTRLPSLNYAGSNVQPSVITHSLTGVHVCCLEPTESPDSYALITEKCRVWSLGMSCLAQYISMVSSGPIIHSIILFQDTNEWWQQVQVQNKRAGFALLVLCMFCQGCCGPFPPANTHCHQFVPISRCLDMF
jgi:hypothetical protein